MNFVVMVLMKVLIASSFIMRMDEAKAWLTA